MHRSGYGAEMNYRATTFVALVVGLAPASPSLAQTHPADLVGTYNGGQTEIGTELRLEANGRYEYYLSYGALDETSKGTWTADANGLVLDGDPVKAPEFQLLETKIGKGKELVVSLAVPKEMDAQYFSVFLLQPDGNVSEVQFPEDGALHIPMTPGKAPSKIAVAFSVYQLASQPYPLSAGKRELHFRFVPNDLGKVAFEHHRLTRDGNAFVLQRFDRTLRFVKESPETAAKGENGAAN